MNQNRVMKWNHMMSMHRMQSRKEHMDLMCSGKMICIEDFRDTK